MPKKEKGDLLTLSNGVMIGDEHGVLAQESMQVTPPAIQRQREIEGGPTQDALQPRPSCLR